MRRRQFGYLGMGLASSVVGGRIASAATTDLPAAQAGVAAEVVRTALAAALRQDPSGVARSFDQRAWLVVSAGSETFARLDSTLVPLPDDPVLTVSGGKSVDVLLAHLGHFQETLVQVVAGAGEHAGFAASAVVDYSYIHGTDLVGATFGILECYGLVRVQQGTIRGMVVLTRPWSTIVAGAGTPVTRRWWGRADLLADAHGPLAGPLAEHGARVAQTLAASALPPAPPVRAPAGANRDAAPDDASKAPSLTRAAAAWPRPAYVPDPGGPPWPFIAAGLGLASATTLLLRRR